VIIGGGGGWGGGGRGVGGGGGWGGWGRAGSSSKTGSKSGEKKPVIWMRSGKNEWKELEERVEVRVPGLVAGLPAELGDRMAMRG